MEELSLIQRIIVEIIPLILAITVHEAAHGWAAKKYGDNTALMMGRLTLNPIKHIDLFGTIILPGLLLLTGTSFIMGWAKPVPVDARNFKRPVHDMAMVALAGPVSNFLMAVGWALVCRVGVSIGSSVEFVSLPFFYMGMAGMSINLALGLINLIPIPPLDGSRVLTNFLPPDLAWKYNQLERYGLIIFFALLATGGLNAILGYPWYLGMKVFSSIAGLSG